jgi:CheY-like chemotaxis protein
MQLDDKYQILFVDDEPSLLSALRRVLYPQGHRWTMTFVTGGDEALETMQRQRYDVVVSDMRMPGMDGEALLREVRRLYPNVYSLILSGYAPPEATSSVMEVAQGFLSKPCDTEQLVRAIEFGCSR